LPQHVANIEQVIVVDPRRVLVFVHVLLHVEPGPNVDRLPVFFAELDVKRLLVRP
jgi:hypothetical protein